MLYLLLAIFSSAMVTICMRISESKHTGGIRLLAINYLACTMIAGIYMGFDLAPPTAGLKQTIWMSLFNGFVYLFGFVMLQISIRKNGVVLSSTFMKLGLLVPMVLSVGLFDEKPGVIQLFGILLALTAIVMINFEKDGTNASSKLGLFLLLVSCGSADAMSKVFEAFGDPRLSEQFLFYTFGFAFLFAVATMLYQKEWFHLQELGYGLLVGIPNYFSARFLLRAVETLPAVIVYPTVSVATLVVISLVGVCFFKERLARRQWVAITMILAALALLNL